MLVSRGLARLGRRFPNRVSPVSAPVHLRLARVLPPSSIRHFHRSTTIYQQKPSKEPENSDEYEKEFKKLTKLKEQFDQGNFVDKWRLWPELSAQLAKVLELELSPRQTKPLVLELPENPVSVAGAQRYDAIFSVLLARFVTECAEYGNKNPPSPDDLRANIVAEFSENHPEITPPVTASEIDQIFELYFRLANHQAFSGDTDFGDTQINALSKDFNELHLELAENPDLIDKVTADSRLPSEVVSAWFSVFETLRMVPSSSWGTHINPLSADETSPRNKSGADTIHNLSQKQRSGTKNAKGNDGTEKKDNGDKGIKVDIDLNANTIRLFMLGLFGGLTLYFLYSSSVSNDREITFQEFSANFLHKNLVSKVIVVNNRTAIVELNDQGKAQHNNTGEFFFAIGSVESFERQLKAVQDDYNIPDLVRVPVIYTSEGSMVKMLVNFLPTLLFLGAIYYMTRNASMGGMGGPLGFGKSTAKKFNQESDIKIRFSDVAGMNEAKEEVMEFVKFLQNPEKYEKVGAKIPRGAILSGPPGTGKTLLAKATAGEAGVPFYSVSGSEFVEMFVGVGASRVRDLFKTARENSPSIVFVDEIDAIGKQRSKGNASGANDERETTLNQLLVEMDGFDTSDHVVVLAGTNRPDILDKALMRPGRFDRHISIDNPELEGRKEIFQVHLRKITLAENIDKDLAGRLAALTPGFSGADIANVCNESALIAARYNAKAVTLRHFELAIERVIGGVEKKSKLLDPEEKRIVAYHEAGHAVCGWYLKHAHPLLKVSIIPRGQGALGYAQYLPPDQYLHTAVQLYDRMIMTLGGRASEELNFSSVTSGAHDDFKKVTNIAQSMVLRFGMSERVGMVNYADTRNQDDLTKPFSDETNRIIDEEVKKIVSTCYDKCKQLLKEKSSEVELVAQELLKKEFITREDMIRLLGKRPFPETNDAFDKYLDGEAAYKNEKPADEKKDDEK